MIERVACRLQTAVTVIKDDLVCWIIWSCLQLYLNNDESTECTRRTANIGHCHIEQVNSVHLLLNRIIIIIIVKQSTYSLQNRPRCVWRMQLNTLHIKIYNYMYENGLTNFGHRNNNNYHIRYCVVYYVNHLPEHVWGRLDYCVFLN